MNINEIYNRTIELSNWEENWNDDGALKPSANNLYDAISYLNNMIVRCPRLLITPNINPCSDGTIDIQFDSFDHQLLINLQDGKVEYFGSHDNLKDNEIAGFEPIDKMYPELINWINRFLV